MAKKTLTGKIISNKMTKTVVLEIERLVKHPIYKKMIKKTNKIKADTNGFEPKIGEYVVIEQSKPISRDKRFVVIKVLKEDERGSVAQ